MFLFTQKNGSFYGANLLQMFIITKTKIVHFNKSRIKKMRDKNTQM